MNGARDSAGGATRRTPHVPVTAAPVTRPHVAADAGADADVLAELAGRAAAQMGAENFPVALRLLPRGVRADLATAYRFARFVDDIGDEAPGGPAVRTRLLDLVADDVRRLAGDKPVPVQQAVVAPVAALAPLTRRHGVPIQTYLDLVEANRRDQHVTDYASFEDLLDYCRLSAAPIGRIVLHIADAANDANLGDSDSVCAALQVLEHCQDVGEDARAGRVYLPADALRAAGVHERELTGAATSAALRRAVAEQVQHARTLLEPGRALVGRLSGWSRIAVAGYVAGGLATADALDAADYDVLGRPVRPAKVRTAAHAVRLLAATIRGRRR